ncbi:MAG: TauD/TfdA family dioxygenase [Gammaproteobacteria bacterium]|nr:TauD/TfdA family dioxygenase [Gammaproteobacteria bacterium]
MDRHASLTPHNGPTAWIGSDIRADSRWRFSLDDAALVEIDTAIAAVRERELPWERVGSEDFVVPRLSGLLERVGRELEDGCGMARLEGLPVDRYPEVDLRRLLFGLGSHLGTPLFQTARGELMGVIADEGGDVGKHRGQVRDPETGKMFLSSRSRAQSTAQLRWHTDRCDVVGLLCINTARAGGVSRLASAVTVSNVMLARRPDLAALLYADIPRSRLGEERGGEHCHYLLPVFAECDGKFTSHYSRTFVEAAQKDARAPRMTDTQWEALDLLASIADEVGFEMELRPGDLQFLNNHVIYHGRTPFEDFEQPERKRRLLRIWLSAHGSRALPDGFDVLWGQTSAGALRGGMCQSALPGDGLQWSFAQADERVPKWFLEQNSERG